MSHNTIVTKLILVVVYLSNTILCGDSNNSVSSLVSDALMIINNDLPSYKDLSNGLETAVENISDLHADIIEIIENNGYEAEKHNVTTKDGYILGVHRIPGKGEPIFLMHGLLLSSDDWVTPQKERGLAFLLANDGYDVWMGNARGNVHSRHHEHLSPESDEFWEFSWDEIGRYDLPAMIDYVLEVTGRTQLQFIGHSQGTTSFFVMCSELSEYNGKIKKMIALSAVAWSSHVRSPIVKLISPIAPLATLLNIHEFLPRNEIMNVITTAACGTPESAAVVCNTIISLFCGFDNSQINFEVIATIFQHFPAGCSLKQLLHYAQIITSGYFRPYDYGIVLNLAKYGSSKPSDYDVSNIDAPVYILHGQNDWFSNITDVEILIDKLPNFKELFVVPWKSFNHMDFLYSKDIKTLVYDKLSSILKIN
ncbi:lipase 3 [Amyelois transitella]|uniref:lipase 3 n=1 Tax=Amyelois transitella TaxID=680683 RepID=UPI00298F5E67|nr:lipase 3 [Amyelois transitella]